MIGDGWGITYLFISTIYLYQPDINKRERLQIYVRLQVDFFPYNEGT